MLRKPLHHAAPYFLSLAFLAACSSNPTGPDASAKNTNQTTVEKSGYTGSARFSIQLGKVGALTKSSAISIKKLILVAISNGTPADTVRDTSSVSGNDQQTVKRVLKLKPKVSWTLYAKSTDLKDSIVHQGATQPFKVRPADTSDVTLILQSRFTMYQVTFSNIPASINVSDDGSDRMGVGVSRLVLKVDGIIKADTTAKDNFAPGKDATVAFDYVPVGTHAVTLEAYGLIGNYQGLLFSGVGNLTAVPGEDGSRTIPLAWAGPNTGAGRVSVILGHVGKLDVTTTFPKDL